MPRKSIFKRNKKKVIKPVEETQEEPALQRSSGDASSLEINQDLYKDIASFGNQLADDGITINTKTTIDYSYPGTENVKSLEYEVKETKKPALKKERKTRRKRRTKAQIEEVKKEEPKKEEPKKDDIMAKLKALEAARQVEINPEPKKEEPKKVEPKKEEPKKDDIMAKLKALEAARQIVIKPEPKQPIKKAEVKIIEEVKTKTEEPKNEALLMDKRSYTFKIDVSNDSDTNTLFFYTSKDPTKKALKMEFNKKSRFLSTFENVNGRWCRSTRLTVKQKQFTIRFLNHFRNVRYQVTGNSQIGQRLQPENKGKIIRCEWTYNNLKMV